MKKKNQLFLALATICFSPLTGQANDADFAAADEAAKNSRLSVMQATYEQILIGSPNSIRALNGLAAAQAWQKNYSAAQATYQRSLALDPRNTDALVGLGYAFAWDTQYFKAHTQFNKALQIDPGTTEARKGIAYTYFWQGKHELALGAFDTASKMTPETAEIEEALGRVNQAMGRDTDAVEHFDRALALEPERNSAALARRATYLSSPALEVTTFFGSTTDAGSGLRQLELAHWLAEGTRVALRYDNSLGLDNQSLSNRGDDAVGYFGAVQTALSNRLTLGLELGRLELEDSHKDLGRLEATYYSQLGAIKLGALLGRSGGDTSDQLIYGGINFPVGDRWRIEPMLYASQSGAADDREWRAVVGADYQSDSDWQLGAFYGGGDIDAADSRFSGSTRVYGLRGSYLIANRYTFHAGIRRDKAPSADFTIAEIGFTYRLISN